jgi:hypothetical protein
MVVGLNFSLEIPTPSQVTTAFRPSNGPPGPSSSLISPESPPHAAVCRSPPRTSSRTKPAPHLHHFPHQNDATPSTPLPLLLFKTVGIESPLPPTTRLARSLQLTHPDPIKGRHTPPPSSCTSSRPHLPTSSPRELQHRLPPPGSVLHRR